MERINRFSTLHQPFALLKISVCEKLFSLNLYSYMKEKLYTYRIFSTNDTFFPKICSYFVTYTLKKVQNITKQYTLQILRLI